jgi:peptide/nickel transport system permease protein
MSGQAPTTSQATGWWNARMVRRFRSNRLALAGVVAIGLLTLACIVVPLLLPYGILTVDIRARFAPPFAGPHILGTDPLGRDIAARVFVAGQTSLTIAFAAMVLSILSAPSWASSRAITAASCAPC